MTDYEWSYETSIDGIVDLTVEGWLRAAWEDGPAVLRGFLPLAWKYGLGLRLGSTSDPARVLGWRITNTVPERVAVDASSQIMHAVNTVTVVDGRIRWHTTVTYANAVGRLMWIPARFVHQLLIPRMVLRAVRRFGRLSTPASQPKPTGRS